MFNAPSSLDILPISLNIKRERIFLQFLFFHAILFPIPLILPSPLLNLIFFPNRLDKLLPLKSLDLHDLVLVYHPGGGQHGPGTVVHKQGGAPQDAGERRAV